MPLWGRKNPGARKVPGAYGESVPKHQQQSGGGQEPPNTGDIHYWQDKNPGSVIATCERCGEQFLINVSINTFREQCIVAYGINAVLCGICGPLVRDVPDEMRKLKDALRKIRGRR